MRPLRLALAALLLAPAALAEGSRELTSTTDAGGAPLGYRPWLEAHGGTDNTTGIARDHQLYVYAAAGESILVASSAVGTGTGDVTLTRPDGSSFAISTLAACYAGGAFTAGVIPDLDAELAGPAGPANADPDAYDACAVPVPAGQGGVWGVHFDSPAASTGSTPTPVRAPWTQTGGNIAAWDITVRSGGADVPGRAFARYLPFTMGAFQTGSPAVYVDNYSRLFVLTEDGYQYRIQQNGMVPWGFIVAANRRGFTDPDSGDKLYRSATRAEIRNAPVAVEYSRPDTAPVGAETVHKLFFNAPAADLPASAPAAAGTAWLLRTARTGAAITGFGFTGADGTPGQVDPSAGGTFTFTTDGEGLFAVRVDLDGNGQFDDPADGEAVSGQVREGANAIAWDGQVDGAAVPAGAYDFEIVFTPYRGEVHFPYFDVERNPNGLVIERLNGPAPAPGTTAFTVYYDDRTIGAAGNEALAGEDSETGAHRWGTVGGTDDPTGDFGNEVALDTWAFVEFSAQAATESVTSAQADLAVVVERTGWLEPGAPTQYTVTITNNGPDDAPFSSFLASLPPELQNVTWTCAAADGGACDASTGATSASGTGAPGGGISVPVGATVTFTLDADLAPGTTDPVTVSATVDAGDADDPVPANDADSTTDTPSGPTADLAVGLTVDAPAPDVGDVVTLFVTVTNEGAADMAGVDLAGPVSTLPPGVELVGATPPPGTSWDPGTGVWAVGDVPVGTTLTLPIQVRITAEGDYEGCAEVDAAGGPDRDSTPQNGVATEDDYACVGLSTTGSTGGGVAGLESDGTLAQTIGAVLFARQQRPLPAAVPFVASATSSAKRSSLALRELFPTAGPEGIAPFEVSPRDLLPVTNALDVAAVDYRRADGRRLAAAFAASTAPGQVYEHTKWVCDRLRGSILTDVETVSVDGVPLVLARLAAPGGGYDYAVTLVAYPEGGRTVLDSRFLLGEYAPATEDDVLNLQLWSVSRDYTLALAADVVARLRAAGPVDLRADAVPVVTPRTFVRRARYAAGHLELEMHNATGARQLTIGAGSVARHENASREPFTRTVELPDGAAVASVDVGSGPLFDAGFVVESDAGRDLLYLADGAWGVAASATDIVGAFATAPHVGAVSDAARTVVERPARAAGDVVHWATLYRHLAPGGGAVDLSAHQAVGLRLAARGTIRLELQTATDDGRPPYGVDLELGDATETLVVPFASLRRYGQAEADFDASAVVAVTLTAWGDGQTARPFEIDVEALSFTADVADATPAALALRAPFPNPTSGRATVAFELPEAERVDVAVFDLLGRRVVSLAEGERAAGVHRVDVPARALAAGVYVVRLATASETRAERLTVVR